MAPPRRRSRQIRRRRAVVAVALGAVVVVGVGIGLVVTQRGSGKGVRSATSATLRSPPSVGSTSSRPPTASSSTTARRAPQPASTTVPAATTPPTTGTTVTTRPPTTLAPVTRPAVPSTQSSADSSAILAGKIVAIDPGHNGDNYNATSEINSLIWNGREEEACDTTGTETDGGYTEALFNFQVATFLQADLQAQGARVVLTRDNNSGVGPCVNERAAIGNNAHANVALSIHADGGPPNGRGFTVLQPVADGINDAIVQPSVVLSEDVRSAFLSAGVEPVSNYYGTDGLQPRDDLGGLNLSTVPKVLVECANMRNATDAALLTDPAWQQKVAQALDEAITQFLTSPG